MTEPTSSGPDCGCCIQDPKTVADRVEELRTRRERIERGLQELERRPELVGAAR